MYRVERFHVDEATDKGVCVFKTPLVPSKKPIAIYDESHAACKRYLGCGTNHCGTSNCSEIAARVTETIRSYGFKI